MWNDLLPSLRRLSDAELETCVKELAVRERGATVLLIAHLAELDTRDVHLRAGYGSLFAYCREVLALSEQESYNRIAVARAARRFPMILEMLEGGAVNITTVRLLAPHLTLDNHRAVLEAARGKSKLQVEEIAARLCPMPDVPPLVRKLPTPGLTARPEQDGASGPPRDGQPAVAPELPATPMAPLAPQTGVRPSGVSPLSPDRYRVYVTIGGDTLEKLQLAKAILRHAVPSGDEAAILDRALTALLTDLAQKKFAATDKPQTPRGTAPGSRHIPAEVKRAVWLRDLGRCAFVSTSGRRCAERGFLEFHHLHPYALGGEATTRNIQLRCRSHNGYEAKACFGRTPSPGGSGLMREGAALYRAAPFAGRNSATRSGTSCRFSSSSRSPG
jgi:hypothetical protein